MRKIFLLLTLALTSLFAQAQKPASVFISAGQSNADGRAYLSEGLPNYMKGGYSHLQFANVTQQEREAFYSRVFDGTQEGNRFSFSDVANYWIDQAMDQDFYSLKCAYGGTAIALGQTVEKLPFWNATEAYLDTARAFRGSVANGTSLAMSLTEGFAKLHQTVLSKLSQGYDVKAIMWHQGESDRKAASAYHDNLKALITYLRKEIYAVTGDEADLSLPFIMGTVSRSSTQYSSGVETAQYELATEMENVYVIDLSDAGLRADNLHFNAKWTEYFGKRVYNKLVEIGCVDGAQIAAEKLTDDTETEKTEVAAEREWNFATDQWSQESLDSLVKNGNYNSGYGYRNNSTITNAELSYNGYVYPETKGLLFTVTRSNRLGIHPSKSALCFIGSEATVVVPQVKPGQFIYVKGGTAKSGSTRGIVATAKGRANLDVLQGDTIASSGAVESVYWVQDSYTEAVDAEFTCSGGQSYLYQIRVCDTHPLGGSTTAIRTLPTTSATMRTYDLQGRQVNASYHGIVVRGGKKFVQ